MKLVRRPIVWFVAAALLVLGGVAGWALNVVLAAPEPIATGSVTTYTVQEGSVGRSLRLNVTASWQAVTERSIGATGTVTSIDLPADRPAQVGDLLLTVDLQPVVLAAGQTPAFRDLQRGDSGADVAQLQELLAHLGYYGAALDGRFSQKTEAAVVRWHKALGVGTSPVVRLGELVFVPTLPAAVGLGAVDVGSQVDPSTMLQVLSAVPELRIALQPEQLDLVQPGMTVTVQMNDTVTWTETVSSTGTAEQTAYALLSGVDGAPVCVDDCSLVPTGDQTLLLGIVQVVPDTSGSVVPSAAVRTDAAGTAYVVGSDGARIDVVVVAAHGGLSVVDGVDVGQVIVVDGPEDGG